jgi:hypothetical protein
MNLLQSLIIQSKFKLTFKQAYFRCFALATVYLHFFDVKTCHSSNENKFMTIISKSLVQMMIALALALYPQSLSVSCITINLQYSEYFSS